MYCYALLKLVKDSAYLYIGLNSSTFDIGLNSAAPAIGLNSEASALISEIFGNGLNSEDSRFMNTTRVETGLLCSAG